MAFAEGLKEFPQVPGGEVVLERMRVSLLIPGMPADFNRIGAELATWLNEPGEPLRIEWKNG